MGLTEQQELNATAAVFDEQLRFFAGPDWDLLIAAGLATLDAWTDPDTGQPVTWTEITARVSYASKFSSEQRGSSITWTMDLSGWEYDEDYLAIGLSMMCWRRLWRPTGSETAPDGWQPWERLFVGEIVRKGNTQDYRQGRAWTRGVTGMNNYLDHYNAPRITAGKIRVTDGAAVSGSNELATPASESGTGEFVGGTTSVGLDNVVDGNHNTVYISNDVPTVVEVAWPPLLYHGGVFPTEVFFKPLPGWSQSRCWWVEVYNQREADASAYCAFFIGNYNADTATYTTYGPINITIEKGAAVVFCANRAAFDEYTGSNNGAAQVIDCSQYIAGGLTNDSAIWTGWDFGNSLAWAPGGASRTYSCVFNLLPKTFWDGPTLDSDGLAEGSSWWYNYAAGTWDANPYPHPGANNVGDGPVWIKVELPDNVCVTLDEIDATSTVIRLDNYRGWFQPWSPPFAPIVEEAQGVINSCVFTWSGRDSTGLTGVTWLNAPGSAIPAGTRCYPYVDGIAQTGYPIAATYLLRRKLPTINHYKVYWSPYTTRDYPDTGWETDYYSHFHEQQGNTQLLRLVDVCADGETFYLWVRTILYLVYAMSDSGRVKVNEIGADMLQQALDLGGTPGLDGLDAGVLARYLWTEWVGLPSADFGDSAQAGSHLMGQHALAITPLTRVFDDLAHACGCLCWYQPRGGIAWIDDPWWPLNGTAPELVCTLEPKIVRGAYQIQEVQPNVEYVILNALSIEGDPHTLRYVYPQPLGASEPPVWAMVSEVNDRVLARDAQAPAIAQMELERRLVGACTGTVVLKGPGEWCRPGLKVYTYFDADGDGYSEIRCWLINSVVTERTVNEKGRGLKTTLSLIGFRYAS